MADAAEKLAFTLSVGELESLTARAVAMGVKQAVSGDPPKWVRVEKVAEIYDVSPDVIMRLIRKHNAPARRVGKDYRVHLERFGAWLDENPGMIK